MSDNWKFTGVTTTANEFTIESIDANTQQITVKKKDSAFATDGEKIPLTLTVKNGEVTKEISYDLIVANPTVSVFRLCGS